MSAGFIDIVTNDTDENGVTTERRIHLNNPDGIFHIREWKPLAPPPEDLYQFSPFEDGRVLAMRKYGNVADEWVMDASGADSNLVDLELEALRALLKKAVDYWIVDWQMEPVWIEMRGDGEANIRYSYIYAWDVPEEANPFANPRNECPSLIPEFPLRIEHGFWLSALVGECVQLSATQTYYDEQIPQFPFSPSVSADDCYVDTVGATISLNANLRLGRTAASAVIYGTGVRFRSVSIPQGAYIIRAWISFMADANLAANNVNTIISGDDVDNSAIFSTYVDFAGRTRTTANTPWGPISAWLAGTRYDSPDITAVVQEIVNRAGWVSGNSLSVLMDDNVSTAAAIRTASSQDGGAPPALYVWYFDTNTRTFGQAASCNPVYFSDRHNKAQLTHAFAYDTSLGTYSANKISAALPYTLFPAVPAIGDILYLICATTAPDSGPFSSPVFDLSVVDAGMTGVWEYWNGAWGPLIGVADFTTGFRNLGVNVVTYQQHPDWLTTAINGVTGYIIRFRVTAVGAGVPTQQNRDVYVVNTGFVDIAASQTGGDVAMLAEFDLYHRHTVATVRTSEIVYMGLRSLKRGLDFSAYINIADEQNNAGVSFTLGANSSWVTDTTSPTGRACYWNPAGTAWDQMIDINFTSALSVQYAGSFMSYLQMRLSTFSNQFWFQYQIIVGGRIYYSSLVTQPLSSTAASIARITTAAFGELVSSIDPKSQPIPLIIRLMGMTSNAANEIYLHALVLIPNDEWIGHYQALDYNTAFYSGNHLNVDPISQIKLPDVAIVRLDTNNDGVYNWDDKSPHFPKLWENRAQRLWLFHPGGFGTGGTYYTPATHTGSFKMKAIKKYFGSWG